jgi:hypothetical protein
MYGHVKTNPTHVRKYLLSYFHHIFPDVFVYIVAVNVVKIHLLFMPIKSQPGGFIRQESYAHKGENLCGSNHGL